MASAQMPPETCHHWSPGTVAIFCCFCGEGGGGQRETGPAKALSKQNWENRPDSMAIRWATSHTQKTVYQLREHMSYECTGFAVAQKQSFVSLVRKWRRRHCYCTPSSGQPCRDRTLQPFVFQVKHEDGTGLKPDFFLPSSLS